MIAIRCLDRSARLIVSCLMLATLVACATGKHPAPVEERAVPAKPAAPSSAPAETPAKPSLNAENAGKPGYYTVRPGDTMIRVGLETGQNWRDIQKWNSIDNANVLEVGQVLRVVAPGVDPSAVAARGIGAAKLDSKPLDVKPGAPVPAASGQTASAPVAAPTAPAATTASPAAREGDDELNWMWPAQGTLVSAFDDTRNKGISISGKAGDPVFAAAEGRVVYAGSGLRGYGNLVIIKHNETFLTAYAHNQKLLVKEDQAVRRGQQIAEMGSTDSERVLLHFEIRRRGKPVDPTRLLPAR